MASNFDRAVSSIDRYQRAIVDSGWRQMVNSDFHPANKKVLVPPPP
jgi:hypothetical protein